MPRSILFVDDEPQLLGGLRRMLWDKRTEWDMRFAEGGQAALALLEQQPADVVVSDVRMPGMDGPELLEIVRRRWPGTTRMILSGHSDQDFVFRSIKPAHQFLTKPCPPEVLKNAIERVLRLGGIFTDERLRETVARIDKLPVLSAVFAELTTELRSPTASVRTISGILSRDVGMTAGVLKLVNSSFFGMPRRVASVEQAITLLGLELVRGVVLSHCLFSCFDAARFPGFNLNGLWEHSLSVARLSRLLATLENGDRIVQENCFMAGLVHDMGKLVLAATVPDDYGGALDICRSRGVSLWEAEMAVLGVSHAEIGAYLLGLWGFEEDIVWAVARHHEPERGVGTPALAPLLVHAANALQHELVVINSGYAPHPLHMDALAALGLDGRVDGWREACRGLLEGGTGE